MRVYLDHAPEDAAVARDLTDFLKPWGLNAEAEDGARGFRPLGRSDVVVALLSGRSVFSTYRMMFEKRLLDAWADGRLVLVKLDHAIPPVGLRDLPAIDATFESSRRLTSWREVERAARKAINDALVADRDLVDADFVESGEPGDGDDLRLEEAPPRGTIEINQSAINEKVALPPAPPVARSPEAPSPDAPSPGKKNEAPARGEERWASHVAPRWRSLVLFVALVLIALGLMQWVFGSGEGVFRRGSMIAGVVAAGVLGLAILGVIVSMFLPAPSGKAKKAGPAAAPPARAAAADRTLPEPALNRDSTVFISYAHADADMVDRMVDVMKDGGHPVWLDKGGIAAGEGWAGEIVRAIRNARAVLVMCSPRAFESDHIKREVYLADRYGKPLLPVFIAPAQMPDDFEYFFAGVQWLELFSLPEAARPDALVAAVARV